VLHHDAKHIFEIAALMQTSVKELELISPRSGTIHSQDKPVRDDTPAAQVVEVTTQAQSVQEVLRVLSSSFPDCEGYSQNRRGSPILDLADEAKLQDLLYFMLKPVVPDLVPEQPVAGHTRQYTIQDFRSRSLRLVLEAKRVRDKAHGKAIKAELHDDIGEYKQDPLCENLVFFVYDPGTFIESPSGLIKSVEGLHAHEKRQMQVNCIVQR
jgi:hypothetical protein